MTIAPFLMAFVLIQHILGVLNDPADGDNALCHQVHTLHVGNGRQAAALVVQFGGDGRPQILRSNGRRGAATDNAFAALGKEQRHHAGVVIPVAGRAKQNIDRCAAAHPHHAGGGIIAGFAAIQAVTLLHQHGGKRLGIVTGHRSGRYKVSNVL